MPKKSWALACRYGKDVPSYDELINIRNRTLERHPKTIFIACHLGNQRNDLGNLSLFMDKYPNLYLDTSARDYEWGAHHEPLQSFSQNITTGLYLEPIRAGRKACTRCIGGCLRPMMNT